MHALYVNEREECEGFGEWLQQQQKCNSDRGDSISKNFARVKACCSLGNGNDGASSVSWWMKRFLRKTR